MNEENSQSIVPPETSAPTSALSLKKGDILADTYGIEELLGEGAFAKVYLARHLMLDKLVAVKILSPTATPDERTRKRFEREARILASLDQENIAKVLGSGFSAENQAFLALEYVPGKTLGQHLKENPKLSLAEFKQIFPPLLDALRLIHDQGVIHRDLKPDNILLKTDTDALVPVLIDFGIARQESQSEDGKLTKTGHIVGTPAYMSPEIAFSEEPGPQSDLYSLACMMYEALSGRKLFSAETALEIAYLHRTEAPSDLANFLPKTAPMAELSRLIMKNLAKDPKARSLDALEFRSELVVLLDNIAQTKELRSLTCKSGKLNQTSTYLLIGLVVSVGAFVYLFLQKPKIAQTELGDTRLQKKIKLSRINLGNLKDRTEQAWLQQRNQSNLNFLLQLLPELAEDRRFHPRDNDSWERLSKTLTIIIQSSAGQMNYPLSLQMSTEAVRLAEENQKPHDLALFLRFQASNLLNLRQTNKAEEAITKAMNIVFKHKDFSPLDNSNIQFTGALVAQQNRKFHLAASRAMAASKVIEHIDSQDKIVYEHRTKYDLFAARQFFRMGTNGMHDKIVKALITRLRSETERNLVNHWIKVSRHYLEIGERSNARESLVEAIRVLSKYPLKPATRMEAVKSLKEILTLNFRDDVEYDSMLESLQEQEIR